MSGMNVVFWIEGPSIDLNIELCMFLGILDEFGITKQ